MQSSDIKVHADTYGFLEQPRDHSDLNAGSLTGNLPQVDSSVARGTRQTTSRTDNGPVRTRARNLRMLGPVRTRARNLTTLIPIVLHQRRHTLVMTLRNWCSANGSECSFTKP